MITITINNKYNLSEEIYKDFEEKIKLLNHKIHNKKSGQPQTEEISKSNDNSLNFENQPSYQNLKRYRQKSESTLRRAKNGQNENESNNNIKKININIYESNNNLDKFKTLINDLRTDQSARRMIDILEKQQNSEELKNILSELQLTMNKLQDNKNSEENSFLSTLPANYLSPFSSNVFGYQNNCAKKKNKYKFDVNMDISEINRNRKIEKLKDKFNDFQQIINKKPKNKIISNEKNSNNSSQKVFNSLYPANNFQNDLFIFEKQ